MLTEPDRKLLAKYLGECWHIWKNRLCDPNRKIETIPECETCGAICKWDGSTDNRTFTTIQDFYDLKVKMVENKVWDEFLNSVWIDFGESHSMDFVLSTFTDWLIHPDRCETVAEWLKGRERC